jgi:outer membrane protein assembly factor BamB
MTGFYNNKIRLKNHIPIILGLFLLNFFASPSLAIESSWTYTSSSDITDLVISPDGSSVIAGSGKVLLFTKSGTLQGSVPYGENLAQTPDGSSIVAVYSTSAYLFNTTRDPMGQILLEKKWELSLSEQVVSCSISDKGNRIAVGTVGGEVNVYDGNGKLLGKSTESSSLIKIFPSGTVVAGLSVNQGLKMYNGNNGKFSTQYDISLSELPKDFFITPDGNIIVYNDAQQIIAINPSNGTQIWKTKATGDVNALAITSKGNYIAAGTDTGSIDLYRGNGSLIWTYQSKTSSRTGQGIEAVTITPDGSKILAGSFDGKIILIDKNGTEIWTSLTKDHIWNVAISSDGSLAAASGETTIYAFSGTGSPGQTGSVSQAITKTGLQSSTVTMKTTAKIPSATEIEIPPSSMSPSITRTPTSLVTEYSIIRTATQSPVHELTGFIALLIAVFLSSKILRR